VTLPGSVLRAKYFRFPVGSGNARSPFRLAARLRDDTIYHARQLVPEFVCSNFAKALAFTPSCLDFACSTPVRKNASHILERDGAELMLEQSVGKDRLWPRAELAYPFGRGINFQIQVADVEHLHAAILAAGVTVYLPLEDRWYRRENDEIGVKQFAVQDPDGYLLRFSQVIGERR